MQDDESPSAKTHSLTVLPDPRQQDVAVQTPTGQRDAKPTEPPVPVGSPAKILTPLEKKLLEGLVIKACRQVYDPEIPVNVYELGLIYSIDVDDTAGVKVKMTLTAPACPVAGSLPGEVEKRIESIPEVRSADVELVWEPAWSKDRMSELARLTLDMM
jgi:FeS assembly SUF system protein